MFNFYGYVKKCKKNINNQAQFTLQCVTTNFTVISWRKAMVKGSLNCIGNSESPFNLL